MSRHAITPREVSMLHIAAQGMTQKHMSRELNIGPNTVKKTMATLLVKLDAANTAQAVAKAVAQGLVKVDCKPR